MKLSRVERWILSNQCRILEQLYPDDATSYQEAREALENGYSLHYRWIAEHIREDELSKEQCREVGEILSMFEELQRGYDHAPDKSGIEEKDVQFPGFDGNREPGLLSYAAYFRRSNGGRFPGLKSQPDRNSHMPLLGVYRTMLEEWNKSTNKMDLSIADVARIVAILHPQSETQKKTPPRTNGSAKKGKGKK